MARLIVRALVPGDREQVYQHVTAFSQDGEVDEKAMESKYGNFLGREANTFTFMENVGGGIKWECTFDPPNYRVMRAIDSSWSDRIDFFEPIEGGTLWTIVWELKARGPAVITQWLAFHLRSKRQVYERLVLPVVTHFRQANQSS